MVGERECGGVAQGIAGRGEGGWLGHTYCPEA